MQVWILNIDHATVVAENFRNAIRHAAAHLFPDREDREHARQMLHAPILNDIGAAGSFAHFLRYHNELNGVLRFEIEEHLAGGKPGEPSLVRRIDCNEGIDPSYFLQRAVWNFVGGGERTNPEGIATALETHVGDALAKLRATRSDRDCLDDLLELASRFAGPDVVPRFGSPSRVLDLVPRKCASAFLDIAEALR